MTIKIGINGMGRIGRMIARSVYENHKKNDVHRAIEFERICRELGGWKADTPSRQCCFFLKS